jgi:hypothetical protein
MLVKTQVFWNTRLAVRFMGSNALKDIAASIFGVISDKFVCREDGSSSFVRNVGTKMPVHVKSKKTDFFKCKLMCYCIFYSVDRAL